MVLTALWISSMRGYLSPHTPTFIRPCTIIAHQPRCMENQMAIEVRCSLQSYLCCAQSPPKPAGANLVGSDLYSKLSAYFISHFKPIIAVRVIIIMANTLCCAYRQSPLRGQKHCKMWISCGTMPQNGIGTRPAQISWIGCSRILIVTGWNVREMRERRRYIRSTQYALDFACLFAILNPF